MPDLTLRLKGDSSDLVKSIEQVEQSIGKLDDSDTLGTFAKSSAVAKARLEELKRTVEELGDQATPELRAEIERLQASFDESFTKGKQRVGEMADEIADVRTQTKTLGSDTFDLQDVFETAFPKISGLFLKAASSVGVFVAAYKGTREVIKFVNDELGINIDTITRNALGLDKLAEAWVGVNEQTEEQKKNADEVRAKFEALHRANVKVVESHEDAAAAAKKSAEEAKKLAEEQEALADAAEDTADAMGEQVEKLEDEADALRDIRNEIDGVGADVLGITGDIRTIFAESAEAGGANIAKLKEKIADLAAEEERLARAFNITEESELRRQSIAAERADLERELIDAQRQGAGAAELSTKDSIAIQSKFRDALAAAQKQIQDWPESAKGAMQAVIDRFQFLNDEVHVNLRDVEEFETAFKGAMAAAGAATTDLESKLERDLKKARDTYKELTAEAAMFTEELRAQVELAGELAAKLANLGKDNPDGGGASVN